VSDGAGSADFGELSRGVGAPIVAVNVTAGVASGVLAGDRLGVGVVAAALLAMIEVCSGSVAFSLLDIP
jgi:hypothetical protein